MAGGGRRRLWQRGGGAAAPSSRTPSRSGRTVSSSGRYLTLIAGCIPKNGGTLGKLVGDAAMAFRGASLPQKDYVMRAVKAAGFEVLILEEIL